MGVWAMGQDKTYDFQQKLPFANAMTLLPVRFPGRTSTKIRRCSQGSWGSCWRSLGKSEKGQADRGPTGLWDMERAVVVWNDWNVQSAQEKELSELRNTEAWEQGVAFRWEKEFTSSSQKRVEWDALFQWFHFTAITVFGSKKRGRCCRSSAPGKGCAAIRKWGWRGSVHMENSLGSVLPSGPWPCSVLEAAD